MISEDTKNPKMYLGPLFVTTFLLAGTLASSIFLLLHVQPCKIPPEFGIWEMSALGSLGFVGTLINLFQLKRAVANTEQAK
jgi:hypothetical protein